MLAAYLRCSVGLNSDNVNLLEAIGDAIRRFKGPALVGADFNNTPEDVAASGVARAMGVKVAAPWAPRGTCASGLRPKKHDSEASEAPGVAAPSDHSAADITAAGPAASAADPAAATPNSSADSGPKPKGNRTIDFFMLTEDLEKGMVSLSVDYNSQ